MKKTTVSVPALNRGHNELDDLRSVGTMSTRDSKSHNTIFSGPLLSLPTDSPTTPSQSPMLIPSHMEDDLRGIGSQAKPSPAGTFNAPASDANHPSTRHDRPENPTTDSPADNATLGTDDYPPLSEDWRLDSIGDKQGE